MGIVYSSEEIQERVNKIEEISNSSIQLQLSHQQIEALVTCYNHFQYTPIIDSFTFHSFFIHAMNMNSNKSGGRYLLSEDDSNRFILLWNIYQVKSMCYIQEVLSCLVLLSHATWHQRVSLLFDIFKCSCHEVAYDDIIMTCQVIAMSLHKLWGIVDKLWDYPKWSKVIETLTDGAFTKIGRELDNYLTKEEFVMWAVDRFKESRSIATPDSLYQLFTSSYQ